MLKKLPLILAFVTGELMCACQEPPRKDFFDAADQPLQERRIVGTVMPADSLPLSRFGADYVSQVIVRDGNVLFAGLGTTVKILRDAFRSPAMDSVTIPQGRGPGEITRISDFDLRGDNLFVMDYSQYKIVVYSVSEGSHVREIRWPEIRALKFCALTDTSAAILNGYEPQRLISIVANDSIHSSFGEVLPTVGGTFNPLTLEGRLECGQGGIFFGGYSEPVLAKYSADGARAFVVKTVAPVNTSRNYVSGTQMGSSVFRFSPDALFSTLDLADNGDDLIDVPHPNGDAAASTFDVYDANSGEYKRSYRADLGSIYLVDVDGPYLYGVRSDSNSEYWIYRFDLN